MGPRVLRDGIDAVGLERLESPWKWETRSRRDWTKDQYRSGDHRSGLDKPPLLDVKGSFAEN